MFIGLHNRRSIGWNVSPLTITEINSMLDMRNITGDMKKVYFDFISSLDNVYMSIVFEQQKQEQERRKK